MGMGQNLITLWYPMIRWFIQKKTNICGHRGRVLNYDTYLLDSKCCQYVELWLNSRGEHQNMFFLIKFVDFHLPNIQESSVICTVTFDPSPPSHPHQPSTISGCPTCHGWSRQRWCDSACPKNRRQPCLAMRRRKPWKKCLYLGGFAMVKAGHSWFIDVNRC